MIINYKGYFLRETNKKKGFTLIELLAVIVILAVIAVIAVPVILNIVNDARKSAAKDSALGYIEAIENKVALSALENKSYEDKVGYVYNEIEANVKGNKPTGGLYTLKNGVVTEGVFCIDGYIVNYENGKAEIANGKCSEESLKLNGGIKLSSNSGNYTYPESKTIEVIENISNGKLTCETSDSSVATCEVSGNKIIVKSGTKEGSATLTIKSSSTSNYKEASAAYVAVTAHGLLSVTANEYSGTYDGVAHGITVESSGATIKYGKTEESCTETTSPTYTNAGTYTVYYQVTKPGYKTVTGSRQVVINKAEGSAKLSSTSGTVATGATTTFTVSEATGTLSCSSSSTSVATCSISGTTVTVNGIGAGTSTITINIDSSTNYNATSKAYSVTVFNPLSNYVQIGDYIKMTPTSTSFTTDTAKTGYTSTQTINPSELNVWRVIRVNSDGTIEVVSENVSSVAVVFSGQTGYKNFVGYLNVLASQYTNTKYVQSTRHMGYNGQTQYLADTASTVDSTSTTAPWTCSTGDSCSPVESKGGGDTLYTTDTTLVQNALGTLVANNPSGTASTYWLASRYYGYIGSTYWCYYGRSVFSAGSVNKYTLYIYVSGFRADPNVNRLRPILTLKSGIPASGSGTSTDPYVLP